MTKKARPTSASSKSPTVPATADLERVKPTTPQASRAAKPSPVAPVALAAKTFSIPDIGMVAGEIWTLLDAQGETSLASLRKSISASNDIVSAAIGWLAREDKIALFQSGRTAKVKLCEHEKS